MIRTARIACTVAPVLAILMLASARGAAAQTSLFQVETANQQKILDVTDVAGFVVRGNITVGAIPTENAGVRLMWYPAKAAFRAGRVEGDEWNDAKVGFYSAALGGGTTASGDASVAMNGGTTASGSRSVAMGNGTRASGDFSLTAGDFTVASGSGAVAVGEATEASGPNSLATGFRSQASGNVSTAIGTGVIASGAASVALGSVVTAAGDGSFIFGDRNVDFALTAAANTFNVRAFGGVGINTGVNIGCDLPAGTGAWACTSSRLTKEDFADVDGEEVLARLAEMRIQRWRYLGTDATHLGPTAEDFHAAFGLGESSTKIASVDANGVALRAVQALERRTAELRAENTSLRAELKALREDLRAMMVPTSALPEDAAR